MGCETCLVLVRWRDARHATNQWLALSAYEPMACVEVMTVGWIVQDDADVLVVAQSMGDVDEDDEYLQVAGLKLIPKSAVISVETLTEERKPAAETRPLEVVG